MARESLVGARYMSETQVQKQESKPAKQAGAGKTSSKAVRAKGAKAKKLLRKRRRRQMRIVLALAALIAVLLVLCGWQFVEYRDFSHKSDAVGVDTFFDGVYIEGVDVSGMTLDEAVAHWENEIEPVYAARTVTLSDGTQIVSSHVGYESNYRQVLQTAFDLCRGGGLQEQFETLSGMGAGVDYTVSRTYCTREALEGIALGIALNTNYLPSDAEPIGFDADTQMFIFGDPTSGQTLDREALYSDIESAFEQGGGEVELKYDYTEGEVPVDGYGLIATYTTDASTSSSARLHNIRLALSTINGTCLEPGEVFSFNGVVGERTKAAGYRPAPAYSRMETVMEYGGGICQVSSTLYAAVEKAGLEIVERHSHSLKVTYIPKGMDATVDWGNKDFKFANNTGEAIYIVGYVDGFEQVHISLYGRL